MARKVKHLSFSSLDTFNTCPKQWRFKYVEGMDSAPWLASWAGSAFHNWVEYWETHHQSPESFRNFFDEQVEFEKLFAEHEAQISQDEVESVWRELGVTLCEMWVEWRTVEGREVLANELEFVVPLPRLRLPIKGFVDAVVNTDVVDWKTGRKIPKPTQIKIYGVILRLLGWDIQRVGYYNARTGKVATWHDLDMKLDDVVEMFKPLDDAIAAEDFPANPGFHCKWCPALPQCQEGQYNRRARRDG